MAATLKHLTENCWFSCEPHSPTSGQRNVCKGGDREHRTNHSFRQQVLLDYMKQEQMSSSSWSALATEALTVYAPTNGHKQPLPGSFCYFESDKANEDQRFFCGRTTWTCPTENTATCRTSTIPSFTLILSSTPTTSISLFLSRTVLKEAVPARYVYIHVMACARDTYTSVDCFALKIPMAITKQYWPQ